MLNLEVLSAYKQSLVRAKDFNGPLGADIVNIPVKTRGQFEYCRKHKIEVFCRTVRYEDNHERTLYFVPMTFEQALFGLR